MFALTHTARAIQCSFGAALLAAASLAGMAQAQTITINQMQAKGDYLLNGAVSDALVDTAAGPASFVDVLAFPFDTGSGAGLHSYGSSNGVFGSRSSGFGVFDVNGSFVINLTITNNQATAQNAVFDFHITPGLLNVIDLPYTGTQFVETGLGFNILTSNGKSFSSTAMLRADSGGVVFNSTGDGSIYGGTGADRFVLGADRTLDLGVLAAGESVTLNYALTSYAKGDAVLTQTTVVPAHTVVIPGYWTTACSQEIPTLMAAAAVGDGPLVEECSGEPVFVPEQVITVNETTFNAGDSGGAQASSGDPFAFNLQPGQLALPPARNGQPVGVTLTPTGPANPVPEPGALSLVLLALAAAGAAGRRRQG